MDVQTRAGRREERSRQTRQKIYDVSMKLFEERGFDGVKVTEICEEADVAIGSFYHFYPSKEHLLLAYTDALEDHFGRVADSLVCDSAVVTLHNLLRNKLEFLTHSGCGICQRELIACVNHHDGRSLDLEEEHIYQFFENALKRGVETGQLRGDTDPKQVTSLLRYMIGGLVLRWCMENGSFDIFQAADKELCCLLNPLIKERQ
ncbi:MAG: TetR/AcrR family transcriptional regulator [Oscillospiraceae bacterium]